MRVRTTAAFRDWIDGLRDRAARARIRVRIDRLAHGNPGAAERVYRRVLAIEPDNTLSMGNLVAVLDLELLLVISSPALAQTHSLEMAPLLLLELDSLHLTYVVQVVAVVDRAAVRVVPAAVEL